MVKSPFASYNKVMTKPLSLSELMSLQGKTALITGAGAGIGAAIAERYAEAGARLQLVDRDEAALAKIASHLQKTYNAKIDTFVTDLSDSESIKKTWDSLSPLPDVLVNNAGIFAPRKIEHITDQDYDRTMNVNTRAVIIMCREIISRRGDRGGVIVNISSIESRAATTPNMLLYAASKAAIPAISRALVKDYASKNWKINTICPGGIMTPGAKALGLAALKKLDASVILSSLKFNSRLPAKSIGQPDDIARAALWLATPMSDYMNGAEVIVDGGFLAV